MSDPQNTRGVPGDDEEADTASGGAPERLDGTHPDDEDDEETDEVQEP